MSAIYPKEFGGSGVEYYSINASGQWMVEKVGTVPLTYQFATSIAIDPQGAPHITFYTQDTNDLALASGTGAGWTINIVDDDGDTGRFASLVIDEEGRFHISYTQRGDGASAVVKYATRGPADTGWDISDVGTLDSLTYGFVGARNITSLALDSQGEAGACRGTRARCGDASSTRATQGASRLGGWERAAGPGHAGVELQRDIRERPGGRRLLRRADLGYCVLTSQI